MHGLIFETSICYWKDQPDKPSGRQLCVLAPSRRRQGGSVFRSFRAEGEPRVGKPSARESGRGPPSTRAYRAKRRGVQVHYPNAVEELAKIYTGARTWPVLHTARERTSPLSRQAHSLLLLAGTDARVRPAVAQPG